MQVRVHTSIYLIKDRLHNILINTFLVLELTNDVIKNNTCFFQPRRRNVFYIFKNKTEKSRIISEGQVSSEIWRESEE